MKKVNWKKIIFALLAFLVPFIIYSVIFFIKGLLTDKTILSGDMYAQYYPLFNYLKEVFNGNNSIFYSFYKGLGGTMFGTIFYYLSSPLNLLLFFIDKGNIPHFMTWLIIIKLSLCGLTMYLYMRNKFKKDNLILLSFSLCYAFMGYNLNYFINLMWLDVVLISPLVLIGIDKIIEEKSPLFYIITLFISIFSNYYLAYMLCIFSVIYFMYEILLRYNLKKDKQIIKKLFAKFIVSSLLVGLMCSFFLIPCILEMLNYGRSVSFHEIFIFDYNFFDLFSKTYIGSLDLNNTLNYSSMNVYCGIVILPLVFLYFRNKKFEFKERILSGIVILLFVLPCFLGILNYFWHLFTIPTFYSYRYSFLLCLFLITIAFKSYENLIITKRDILLFLTFYLIISFYFIIITYFGNYYSFLDYKLIWITLFLLITYFVIMCYIGNNRKGYFVVPLLMICELILNLGIVFYKFDAPNNIEIDNYEKVANIMNDYNDINNRIENSNYFTFNDSILNNYSGVSNFLSTTNNKSLEFIYAYGFDEFNLESANFYVNLDKNYMLDSILGIKHIIYNNEVDNYKLVDKLNIDDKQYYIYNNPNSIGYGVMVKNRCNNIEYGNNYNEDLFNCLFNTNLELFKEYKKNKDGSYSILKKDYFYVYMNDIIDSNFEELNDSLSENLLYRSENYYIYNNFDNNHNLKFNFDDEMDTSSFKVMFFDYDLFSKLSYNKLDLEYKNNNYLRGNINVLDDGILMITLPYENGFNVYVDNNLVDYFEVANTFIGVNLKRGGHTILVKYKQPGLRFGIILSVSSLLLTFFYLYCDKRSERYL